MAGGSQLPCPSQLAGGGCLDCCADDFEFISGWAHWERLLGLTSGGVRGHGKRVQAAWKPHLTFQSEGAISVMRKDHRRPQVLTAPAEPESLSPGWISEAWSAIMTSRPFQNCLCKTSDCQLQGCEPDCVSLLYQGRDHFHRESSHLS